MDNNQALKQITEWAGSQANLARMLKVSRAAVHLWKQNGIPARRAIEIERLSGGRFRAGDIAAREFDTPYGCRP